MFYYYTSPNAVAASRQADSDNLTFVHLPCNLGDVGNSMRRFQCRNDSFQPREQNEGVQASLSVTEWYFTRPISFNQLCSGPTPG